MLDGDAVRRNFPVVERYAYFATNRRGPISTRVRDTLARALDDHRESGVLAVGPWFDQYEQTRSAVAALVGCEPAEVAFTGNVTGAVAAFAHGLDWRPGDNVVITDREYPANVFPWMRLRERGVDLRLAPAGDVESTFRAVCEHMDARTRVVSLSLVEFSTGVRHDVARYVAPARDHGALLFVDAVQGLGCVPMRMGEWGVDAVAGDGRKWLCATDGAGFLALRGDIISRFTPHAPGAGSVRHAGRYLDYTLDLWPDARRFEGGARSTLPLLALGEALCLMGEHDARDIENHVLDLAEVLSSAMEERGVRVLSPRERASRSGIVVFDPGAGLATDAARKVRAGFEAEARARDVVITARGGPVTAALHWFNNQRDVQRLLEVVDATRV